jgi:hypothetical protein
MRGMNKEGDGDEVNLIWLSWDWYCGDGIWDRVEWMDGDNEFNELGLT